MTEGFILKVKGFFPPASLSSNFIDHCIFNVACELLIHVRKSLYNFYLYLYAFVILEVI